MRSAVEHSFKRVVIRKLHQRETWSYTHQLQKLKNSTSLELNGVSASRGRRESYLEGALAMVAPEAGLVVDPVVGGELVDKVHGLIAGVALGGRPLE